MRPILILLLALCLIAGCKSAEEEYDYDDEPAPPPVTPAPARPASRLGSLLSSRGRAPVGRKPAATTSTTPKPIEQAVDDAIDEGEEFLDENQEQEEISTTTTEATKKLRAGGVRPFRSNEDLLAALKRRRAQVGTHPKETTSTHSPAEPTTPKSKSSGGRSRIGTNDAATKSTTRGRFGGNTKTKVEKEEVEETQQDEIQVKPKPYRRG